MNVNLDRRNLVFFTVVPALTLIFAAHSLFVGWVSWPILLFALVYGALTNFSITAGYHRLYAHRAYKAHPLLRWFYLLVGASAIQGSALKWASDHRVHHNQVDSDQDPYSISKGFWFAHMGWLFDKRSTYMEVKAPDLNQDKAVMFQDKHYVLMAIFMGYVFPGIVGFFLGNAWSGFVWAGAVKVLLSQQTTFFVNSLAHTSGSRPYCLKVSARDNLLVAFLTHGEGYHNYHHRFQTDYRNGIKWYHWDPTKWAIKSFSWLGLASNLRRIPAHEVLKARLIVEETKLVQKGFSNDRVAQLKAHILTAQNHLKALREEYDQLRKQRQAELREHVSHLKYQIHLKQVELEWALSQWRIYLQAESAFA